MQVGDYNEWMKIAEARSSGHDQDGCIGIFYDRAIQNMKETEKQGRAVFDQVPYCEILVPGSTRAVPVERATEEHRKRFPKAWEAYLQRRSGLADGAPLEQWAYLNVAQVAELKHAGVHSVEQLAAVSDGNLGSLGAGGRELRERARQYLKSAPEVEQELRAQIADQAKEIQSLKVQIEQLKQAGKSAAKAAA